MILRLLFWLRAGRRLRLARLDDTPMQRRRYPDDHAEREWLRDSGLARRTATERRP